MFAGMWSFGTTMTMAKDHDKLVAATPPNATATIPQNDAPKAVGPLPERQRSPLFSERTLRQLSLFAAGGVFLGLSTLVTRRAIARKYIAGIPKFYNQSNHAAPKIDGDGGFVAVEALSLATLNVMGFGILFTGGLAYAFDVASVDDLRAMARKHTRPGPGTADEAEEREMEAWANDILEKFGQKKQLDSDSSTKEDK
jgi:hypothetical protein